MAVERRLTELAGPVGGRLHTARSRNDQVATDVALCTRERAARRGRGAADLRRSSSAPSATGLADARLHAPAARAAGAIAHHLLAYVWMLRRDRCRFASRRARRRRCRWAPARWPGVIRDRPRRVAAALGFAGVAPNSIDAVSNRDFCWTTSAPPRPARCTSRAWPRRSCCGRARSSASSSWRRVVDGLVDHAAEEEPGRRRAGARQGAARHRRTSTRCSASMKGLPLDYNRDLQEDKEHLFDAADTLELSLAAARGMVAAATLRPRAYGRRPPRTS